MASAARYYPRAPRYVFRPEDQSLMRFAGMERGTHTTRARIRDVSATGISFVVEPGSAPAEGEMLKVEFGLPGKRQFAWFATVARVESRIEWEPVRGERAATVVGLRFSKLPAALAKAIARSVRAQSNQGPENRDDDFAAFDPKQVLLFCLLTIGGLLSMALIACPPALWFHPFKSLL